MTRFAQLWLPQMKTLTPACALARAQHWLRTCTRADLLAWNATLQVGAEGPAVEDSLHDHDADLSAASNISALPHSLASLSIPMSRLVTVRGRGSRFSSAAAESKIREWAWYRLADKDHPYAYPIYWAGFQIMGW